MHAGGIDRPLFMTDGRVPNYNWRGLVESSSWADGAPADCSIMTGTCTTIAWPGKVGVYMKPGPGGSTSNAAQWVGNVIQNGAGSTGLLFRRNRSFDPSTGQFTQQDPIGLAGGLNLYGYANGDPINLSDPFGLCPPADSNTDDCQSDANGKQKASYCPAGTSGTPPNCTSVATGAAAAGSCPNVSSQEWDLGQQAIALTTGTEEAFLISRNGSVQRADGPDWIKTGSSIGPSTSWPASSKTFIHSHPSGGGISPGDVGVAERTGIRIVSAGVSTSRYGSAQRGQAPVSCNMPARPNP